MDKMDVVKNMAKIGTGGGPELSSDSPFVSVMVLNYSYGDLLTRALEACAAQTFRDFEVVMINNGAIDNTEEIYKDFCAKHPEIRTTYVHVEPNQGPMHGWNEGLKQARGEYVMFNDADDWMDPDCLEKLAQKAKETGADRVMGQVRDVREGVGVVRERRFSSKDMYFHSLILQGAIFRRAVILEKDLFFPREDVFGTAFDTWLIFNFAVYENKMGAVVRSTLYNYWIHSRSVGEDVIRSGVEPFLNIIKEDIRYAAEAASRTSDVKLKQELECVTIRCIYGFIITTIRHFPPDMAKLFHDQVHKVMDKAFPNWKKNPLLWPFGNGYALFTSACLYALVWMDRLHAMWMIRLAGKMSKLLKFRR